MPKIMIQFPVKTEAQPPWPYPTMHIGPFEFSFEVEMAPRTAAGALIAAAFFRSRFLEETLAASISSAMQPLTSIPRASRDWIPSCYLSGGAPAYADGVRLPEK